MAGMSVGGRTPGKVTINTMWDNPQINPAVFQAICSALPQSAPAANVPNYFTAGDVTQIFTQLMRQRTPATDPATGNPMPSPADRPFLSLTTGFSAPFSA